VIGGITEQPATEARAGLTGRATPELQIRLMIMDSSADTTAAATADGARAGVAAARVPPTTEARIALLTLVAIAAGCTLLAIALTPGPSSPPSGTSGLLWVVAAAHGAAGVAVVRPTARGRPLIGAVGLVDSLVAVALGGLSALTALTHRTRDVTVLRLGTWDFDVVATIALALVVLAGSVAAIRTARHQATTGPAAVLRTEPHARPAGRLPVGSRVAWPVALWLPMGAIIAAADMAIAEPPRSLEAAIVLIVGFVPLAALVIRSRRAQR
jgi:hypothetical protein